MDEENNEMGVLIERDADAGLYADTYAEVQRLIRISDEVKLTVEKVPRETKEAAGVVSEEAAAEKKTRAHGQDARAT